MSTIRPVTPDVLQRFLEWECLTPDRVAVVQGGGSVTYGELAQMARAVAGYISKTRATRVLIALPPSAMFYSTLIGTVMAGGYYIPVNAKSPLAKIIEIIETTDPELMIVDEFLLEPLRRIRPQLKIVTANELSRSAPMLGSGRRHEIAYIIMTSGSTGRPKGVIISKIALAHFLTWLNNAGYINQNDRVSQFSPVNFDLSVLEIYGCFAAGATLVTPEKEGQRLFPAEFARETAITVWISVPSAVDLVARGRQARPELLGRVRIFLFCGEPLTKTQISLISDAAPTATIVNLYGPTETTVAVTAFEIHPGDQVKYYCGTAPLGDAIPGMQVLLVGQNAPIDGEIAIAGKQLAEGYLNDQARTALAFSSVAVEDAYLRSYLSGDAGRRQNGHLYFVGRLDEQFKVNGFRVEQGEIIFHLAKLGINSCVVASHSNQIIVVIETEYEKFSAFALRSALAQCLDRHAIPSRFFRIKHFPRLASGKVDKNAVRAAAVEAVDRAAKQERLPGHNIPLALLELQS